ncbi:uncharacterized protein LOC121602553 isoform X2 [Anopheles merus]|nr:uncharacterized protein LOC121600114 isoform X2 [Anopheles merus]XP_041786408.1 uncharacterized protein LOC121601655 isoform X2 [Anopheles merus]XP_041787254.1 uncharacterized protein LOC121602553 isoform X2 [Anopheles merus]
MEHDLLRQLGISGKHRPLCISWTGNQSRVEDESVELSVKISGVGSSFIYDMNTVHTVRTLGLCDQSVEPRQLATQYSHLRGLPLPLYQNASAKVLIGIDNCFLSQTLKTVERGTNEPSASKTRLGWVVYGPCSSSASDCNRYDGNTFMNVHICPCNKKKDDEMDLALKEYFSLESLGVYRPMKQLRSDDEEHALKILSSNVRLVDGHFEASLLWKYDTIKLPDNKAMALRRHECLERKLRRNPELNKAMHSKIAEYEQKGYIRKLSPIEQSSKKSNDWFLPIFPVTNPNKPGKIRVVFDAAAKVNGVSLNSFLLTGPDQLVGLLTVLYKFREYKVAVTGDIREMFFQVRMNPRDQRSQMFLWNDGEIGSTPQQYVLQVMTFGAACSPSTAHYVKNLNAERFEEQYQRAVECIKYEHYVDDMLSSIETEDEAIQLAQEVCFIHSQGGFEIRNWLSNSSKVKAAMNRVEPGAEAPVEVELATEKVLGMWWNTETDVFTFKISPRYEPHTLLQGRVPTKREILKILMSIYDPLGLIGHLLMYLKILLQEVWRAKTQWDEEISGSLLVKWQTWVSVLPSLQFVSIPRCYRQATHLNQCHIELHIFCDASENGMAAVAYFRFERDGLIECALVGSKTKVAPISFTSIPRLELQAAVIGTRLAQTIKSSHRLQITREVYWTDSRTVISWINADHRKYSQFVAVRISEIVETSNAVDWNWVSTKMNVADEGTKWQKVPELGPTSRWFRGPDFLWKSTSEWPKKEMEPGATDEEIRHKLLHHSMYMPLLEFTRFSKWQRLLRAVAYVYRFITNCRKGKLKQRGELTQDELVQAENAIYRQAQRDEYADEIGMLSDIELQCQPWKKPLKKTSPLYQLSPFIDEHKVLRMKGRIEKCMWVGDDTKRPVIIPNNHYATELIISWYHEKYRHANHQTALNEIRLKYHVPKLKSTYSRVRRCCQYCKVYKTAPQNPAMGDLPYQRLAAYQHPFSYTGIDYFGPMIVAVGRRTEKRWGVIFTCLTTRGIHIEVAHSLSTDSCIFAIRNFTARKGLPLEFVSDRGTNFVGASRELKEAAALIDVDRLMAEFVQPGTKWVFNPPAAPHFGGSWERLIQSIKKTLASFDLPHHPTDELLRARLSEVELIVNSRPLTEIPLEDEAESPLTPNHFILGSSNGSKPPLPFDDSTPSVRKSWKSAQQFADMFWKRWVIEYLPTLTKRSRWYKQTKPLDEGDLVLVADGNNPRNCWPRGRIVKVYRAADNQVRRVTIQTNSGLLDRPAVNVAILEVGTTKLSR